ncbi:MAG: PqqD family protein [Deltaproteobacteria bacterium]|nr:MAG: PqqD family protein [Deltaproteobacteria bacterium]
MKPKRNPEVMWRVEKGIYQRAVELAKKGEDFEDIGVLSIMYGNSIHQLNLVGAEIWMRINGINDVDKITQEISELFDADPEEMRGDVEEFIESLRERGWVLVEEN